jgi:tRNA(Arg) A34 adenosine deaminase TadA
MEHTTLILTLPVWIEPFLSRWCFPLATAEERMRMVIALAGENINRKSGGPFAAAVFDAQSGDLFAVGVNRVTALNCSIAHAEMMAIGLAQQRCDSFDLSAPHLPAAELVTSTEPCAMCLGAIPWSGIRRLVCGATDADARAAGFDEGAKPENWQRTLEERGISVVTGVASSEAAEVLRTYREGGGILYNGSTAARTDFST